jgi:S-formylglutathione hydrolase FrmB
MRLKLIFVALLLSIVAAGDLARRVDVASGVPTAGFDGSLKTYLYHSDAIVKTEQLKSQLLMRTVSYRIILPSDYDRTKERYPVIYLLHGLFGHFDNWTEKTGLARYAAQYNFIIVTPEGGDGWYTDSATVTNDKYESYIFKELIPDVDSRYRTLADRGHRAIAGLSMGGYGSLKFGLKYPEMFSVVGSFSGALDPLGAMSMAIIRPSVASVFGTQDNATRADNDIFDLLPAAVENKAVIPYIYFSCGTEDPFLKINRDFDTLLLDKKVPHEFRETPGGHSWTFWDEQVAEFLRVANQRIGPNASPSVRAVR